MAKEVYTKVDCWCDCPWNCAGLKRNSYLKLFPTNIPFEIIAKGYTSPVAEIDDWWSVYHHPYWWIYESDWNYPVPYSSCTACHVYVLWSIHLAILDFHLSSNGQCSVVLTMFWRRCVSYKMTPSRDVCLLCLNQCAVRTLWQEHLGSLLSLGCRTSTRLGSIRTASHVRILLWCSRSNHLDLPYLSQKLHSWLATKCETPPKGIATTYHTVSQKCGIKSTS